MRKKQKRVIHLVQSALKRVYRHCAFGFFDCDAPSPKFIQLEITTKCNCNCITCSRSKMRPERLNKDLSFEEFKHIISQIPSLREIKLQGMGEPLLCCDLEKILAYGISQGIIFSTITNGTVISRKNVDMLLKYFTYIAISFDAGSPFLFSRIRCGAQYDYVLENIVLLIEQKKKSKGYTKIALNVVASHYNVNELESFLDKCQTLGIDLINIVEAENWFVPTQSKYLAQKTFIQRTRSISKNIAQLVRRYRGTIPLIFISSKKRKQSCHWPFYASFITVDGFVTPCCIRMDPDAICFGNVFTTPFYDIWNSEKYKSFRKNNICNRINPICDYCPD